MSELGRGGVPLAPRQNAPGGLGPARGAVFAHRWWAKLLLLAGRPVAAERVFKAILVRAPNDRLALNSLGYGACQAGRHELALSYFSQVRELQPLQSNVHFNVAFVCEELGRLDEAELAFRQAIAMEPTMDRAWYGLGLVLLRQERLEDAVAAFRRNTALQPMSPLGWCQLARAHAHLAQAGEALKVVKHLQGFEPRVAAELEREIAAQLDGHRCHDAGLEGNPPCN